MAESLPIDGDFDLFAEIDARLDEIRGAPHAREALTEMIARAIRSGLHATADEVVVTSRIDENFDTHFDLRVKGYGRVALHDKARERWVRGFLEEAQTRYRDVLSAASPAAQLDAARSLSDDELAALARARRHAR